MILLAFTISIITIAIHALFWDGMVLSWMKPALYRLPQFMRKPLFECLICMSSFWTLVIMLIYGMDLFGIRTILVMLMVCGINVIWDSLIYNLRGK